LHEAPNAATATDQQESFDRGLVCVTTFHAVKLRICVTADPYDF